MTSNTTSKPVPCKPRRPLSSYNLFYRYKRVKIIEANLSKLGKRDSTLEDIHKLVNTTPGLENYPESIEITPEDKLYEIRRTNIRLALKDQLLSRDSKNRRHRKSSHGLSMPFVEMNKLMLDCWKGADQSTKDIFQELANDGKQVYQDQLKEYIKMRHNTGEYEYFYGRVPEIPKSDKSFDVASYYHVLSPVASSFPAKRFSRVPVLPSSSSPVDLDSSWEPLPFSASTAINVSPIADHNAAYISPVQERKCITTIAAAVNLSPSLTSLAPHPSIVTPTPSFGSDTQSITPADFPPPPFANACIETKRVPTSLVEPIPLHASSHLRDNVSVDDFMKLIETLSDV